MTPDRAQCRAPDQPPARTPNQTALRSPDPAPAPRLASPRALASSATLASSRALALTLTPALTLALAAALALAACGGNAPTGNAPTGNAPTSGPAQTTPGPGSLGGSSAPLESSGAAGSSATASPGAAASPGATAEASFPPGPTPYDTPPPGYQEETPPPHPTPTPKPTPTLTPNKALEAKLPNAIRGVKLAKDSYSGTNMKGTSASTIATLDLLDRLHAKKAQLSIATAADPTGKLPVFLQALQIAGAPTEPLFSNYLAVIEKYSQRGVEKDTARLGGKNVTTVIDIDQRDKGSKAVLYLYAKGDIVYVVSTADPALAADALKAMP